MKMKRLLKIVVAITILIVISLYLRIDYFVVRPSRAVELDTLITVEDADRGAVGKFYLVTVSQQRASLLTAAFGYLHPYMELKPMESVIPEEMDEEEYRQQLRAIMVESQHLAQVVALRRAGFEVDIITDGVEIVALLDSAPSEGYLAEGDTIVAVDGTRVYLATEVTALVQDRFVGQEVRLELIRDELKLDLSVPTGASPDDPELPFLGILIQTLPWEPVIPIEIYMNTGRIGGPSAGLMFVLEILNQLTSEDLTSGKKIAGTGTIDLNENVGRVGGVRQKVVAAKQAGAEYFFVPEGNYYQAVNVVEGLEIIPVLNLEEVLEYLSTIE